MEIRPYHKAHLKEMVALFFETVHNIPAKDYTPKQLDAWAGKTLGNIDFSSWGNRFATSYTLVAKKDEQIIGFGNLAQNNLAQNNLVDCLYVHQNFQRQKVATALLLGLENKASSLGLSTLQAHVSIAALPFFRAKGFRVIKKQYNPRKDEVLVNYLMEKVLS